jgi:hypothetical protein
MLQKGSFVKLGAATECETTTANDICHFSLQRQLPVPHTLNAVISTLLLYYI